MTNLSYLRNLPVPYFSQRQNDYQWQQRYLDAQAAKKAGKKLYDIIPNKAPVSMDCRTCNITSVMMVMKYLGLTGIEKIDSTNYKREGQIVYNKVQNSKKSIFSN